ncbi:sulfotransferase [Nitzschia inconspicua]|uniref:Sulfotransferase n=1 Tax=Nitzschia inconspicua TaxID=303405 RepID=A0A9K3LUI0_9STRA|nr:sulfotransferase [Nitzschia inconspicua]
MPPSSPEEIARQHLDAVGLVEEARMPYSPRRELGEISLQDKVQPTWLSPTPQTTTAAVEDEEKKDPSDSDSSQEQDEQKVHNVRQSLLNPDCWSTRGQVDVSKLQKMVQEGYNEGFSELESNPSPSNYWDPRNAAKHNVNITRPSHDGWGIGKIVLRFSDDFLTKVYQLPWWKDFEDALQPIMDILTNSRSNHSDQKGELVVVRALLASLPPGVTIPVHNDSGEWVKTTHRVHVPVLVRNPDRILFRVGLAPHVMQRIDCTPGHVFEINNQAKHAVSNCDDDHRVHLILDYVVVDTTSSETKRRFQPILLEPGEKLVQTRRSIDRLREMSNRPTPSYIILGAQKAGTTSLYDYINQHPWVVQARRRETHCLDWRWNNELKTKKGQLAYCRKFFYAEELKKHPSCLTGDSTPSYLLDSRRVIPRVKALFDWKISFFVMMRDPVRRAASHYAMVTSKKGTPKQLETRGKEWRDKSFWQVVQLEVSILDACGLIPYWDIEAGCVNQKVFDAFHGSAEEAKAWNLYLEKYVPLNTGSYGLLARGMYAVQLRPWFDAFPRDRFLCLRLESMKADGVDATMKRVWKHLDLPNHPVHDDSAKNTREYSAMDQNEELYLQRFFEPHNRVLASVLGSSAVEWQNPWPYMSPVDRMH